MNKKASLLPFYPRFSLIALGLALFVVPAEAAPPEQVKVIIRFSKAPGVNEENLVKKHGGKVNAKFQIVPAVSATIPAAAAANIRRARGVVAVEPDGDIEAHDLGKTWGVARIGCAPVHAGTFGENVLPVLGAGVRVAIVDSGIDYTHADLRANYAGGYDYVNNDADPFDDQGHGTHVAGIVAAMRNGTGVVGTAPEASLYGIKVLGADGSGSWSWIISSLDWCVKNGISVANFSLGSSSHPGSTVENAFKNAAAAGLLMIASAGNAGAGTDTVGFPAKFPGVVAVASTTSSDQRSSFSSTGPAVEIAAPGSSIYSTLRGGGYGYMSGTSMAAPHVTGAAALLIAAGVADSNGDGKLAEDVRVLLQVTAEDLGTTGADNEFGHGLVNAEFATLLAYGGSSAEPPTDPEPLPVFDAPGNLSGTVSSNTVSLMWSDNSNIEEGFQIQYGVKSKSRTTWYNWASVGTDTQSYSASISNGTYLFRVRAVKDNAGSFTNWSNQIELKVGATATKPGKLKKATATKPGKR
jgi:subtilisin